MTLPAECLSILTSSEQENIKAHSSLVDYQNKDVIFKQNTRVSHYLIVKKGLIKVFKENRGDRNFIYKLAVGNDFIGLNSILGSDTHHYSASSIGESQIFSIDKEIVNTIIKSNPAFASYLLEMIAKESLFINDRLLSQITKQLPGRIADVILYFSEDIYHSLSFELPLTRKELADLAGTTKESFIRTLTEFKNDKIIDIEENILTIRSMDIIKTLHLLG